MIVRLTRTSSCHFPSSYRHLINLLESFLTLVVYYISLIFTLLHSRRERLKLKQDLLRKQRVENKEREDYLKSETASSASSSCASIIRRKSEQGLEIQAKSDELKAAILKSQNKSSISTYDVDDLPMVPSSERERSQEGLEAIKKQKSSESKAKRLTSRSYDNDSSSSDDGDNGRNMHSRRKTHSQNANVKALSSVPNAGMILTTQDKNYKGQGQDISQLSNCRSSSSSVRNDMAARYRGEYDDGSLERSVDSVYGFDSIDRVDTDMDPYGVGAQGAGDLTRTLSVGSSIQGSKDSGKSGGSLYGRLKRTIIKTVGGKKDTEGTPERDTSTSTSRSLMSAGSHSRLISSSGAYLGSKDDSPSSDRVGTPTKDKDGYTTKKTPDRPVSTSFLSLSSQKLMEQNKYIRKTSASSLSQMANEILLAKDSDSD